MLSGFAGLVITGRQVGWGPFEFLQFDSQEKEILNRYDQASRRGEIIFYGASNFRLWTEMEIDLTGYKVQNHGFGGSTDHNPVCDDNYSKRQGRDAG